MKNRLPKKANALGQESAYSSNSEISRKLTSRSTETEAQILRLAEMLRLRPHHTYELRRKGISHPAGRVQNLEERGFVITSDRISTVDPDGFTHCGVALYSLVFDPEAKEAA